MFGKGKSELNRLHLVAVRLVDEVSRQLHELFPDRDWTPVGFRLKAEKNTNERLDFDAKLEIRPAHWPKGSLMTCTLIRSGGRRLLEGEIIIPGLGKGMFSGDDMIGFRRPLSHQGLISVALDFSKE